MPTQRYDAPYRKIGKIFVGILSIELDGVRARNWNAERVIVFKSVILQCAQGVNNSDQIYKRVFFRLDFWNRGAFDKLVKDTYNSAMGYLGKTRRNQMEEQRHRKFSNLFLKIKLREAFQLVCNKEKGGVLQPEELAEDHTVTINETVASVLEGKHVRNLQEDAYFYSYQHHRGSRRIGSA